MNLLRMSVCCVLVATVATGCSRNKKPAEPTTPPPTSQAAPLDGLVASDTAPPPPPAPAAAQNAEANAPAPPGTSAESAATSREQEILRAKPAQKPGQMPSEKALMWACDRFLERYGRDAKNLEELVAKGLITVPPLPAGKKYLLDAHNITLTIVDK